MKNVILYALIFSILFNIFQYVNSTKILEAKEHDVSQTKERLKIARDSVANLAMANYFAIESDENAQEYFYRNELDYQKIAIKVKEDLLILNENKNGNKLIPYEPVDGKPFLVNTSKILNHRWIIAEFSNGDLWGQILVKYFVTEGKATDFETIETVLYERHTKE